MADLSVGEIRIAYDDAGAGRAVILLHGYPFNRSLWSEQVAALTDKYRVITPDLRGHGESDTSDGPATMSRMAQDVALLMDALAISRATIGGLSMGGYVALAFYRQFPDRVDALILADTRAQADTIEGREVRAEQAKKVVSEGMAPIVDAMLPKLVHPETVSKRPEVVKRIRDMMQRTKPAGAAAALQGMAKRDDQMEYLSQIRVPTLIIVGREDAITPLEDSETMHEKISGSQLIVIENAGHVSNLERPEQFNVALIDFLQQSKIA